MNLSWSYSNYMLLGRQERWKKPDVEKFGCTLGSSIKNQTPPQKFAVAASECGKPGNLPISQLYQLIGLPLKGQSHEIFCTRFFLQSVHSGPIRDVHWPFFYVFCMPFHRVIALLKWLPCTLETEELKLPGTLDTGELWLPGDQSTGESLLFYLDLYIGLHGSILNLKYLQIVGLIDF